MTSRKTRGLLVIFFIIMLVSSCNNSRETLTIGLIPVRDSEEMLKDFEPMKAYLEEQIGLPIEVVVTENYVRLIQGMKSEEIDIGWYGAFSYIAAETEIDLTPLVVQVGKDKGTYYNSLIITPKKTGIRSIEALKNKRFAFVDSGSTSGFILPYALFKSRNIEYEHFFSQTFYAGSHDRVPLALLENEADAGAISSVQFNALIKSGKIKKEDFLIIWKSEDIPQSPYVARSKLDQDIQESFTDAMLKIHIDQPKSLEAFDVSIEKYVDVESKHYNSIRNIATILGKDSMYEYFLKGE
jgi:phosphonate transport system substrate-binding protein